MQILFIYPTVNIEPKWSYGIGSLASALEAEGHRCALLFLRSTRLSAIKKAIAHRSPELIALSSTTNQWPVAVRAAEYVRKSPAIPDSIPIIVGGIHPTIKPDCIHDSAAIDAVCIGEAELALPAFVTAIETEGEGMFAFGEGDWEDREQLPNIWLRSRTTGTIYRSSTCIYPNDLDQLPFPSRKIFPEAVIRQYPSFIFQRGCPFNCGYCCNAVLRKLFNSAVKGGVYLRSRSPRLAIEEVENVLGQYRPEYLLFDDDLFIQNRKWLQDFLTRYQSEVALPFRCNARPEYLTSEVCDMLRTAGCDRVNIGVESGSEPIRTRVLGRGIPQSTIIDAFKAVRAAGIRSSAFNMIGLPQETPQEFQKTIRLNRELRPEFLQLSIYYPYPGTDLGRQCLEQGLVDTANPLEQPQYDYFSNTILKLPGFPARTLLRLKRRFRYEVYRAYDKRKALQFLFKDKILSHPRLAIPLIAAKSRLGVSIR